MPTTDTTQISTHTSYRLFSVREKTSREAALVELSLAPISQPSKLQQMRKCLFFTHSRRQQLSPGWRHLVNSTKHVRRLWFWPFCSIMRKMTQSTKPEIRNITLPSEKDRATDTS